ncbi:MAG: membrane protein [Patescibacteria group bacterium]|nr:MAG: membrane protein [Patescibacteria group bacterium]
MKRNILLLLFAIYAVGCDSFIERQKPQTSLPADEAITSEAAVQAAVYGAYSAIQSGNYYGLRYLLFPDLIYSGSGQRANLRHTGTFPSWAQFNNANILADNVEVSNMWATIYNSISRINYIIEAVNNLNVAGFTEDERKAFLAEAHFLRAFHYFNLVRWWGGVPIVTQPVKEPSNLQIPRNTVAEVYQQIENDLAIALADLPTSYGNTIDNKGRATLAAAYALKAYVHLEKGEWADAAAAAQQALVNGGTLVSPFKSLFESQNTSEAIWELQFNPTDQNSIAFFLLPGSAGGRNEANIAASLNTLFDNSGETGTGANAQLHRRVVREVSPRLKYYRVATGNDNVIIYRNAEMWLVRAEALVEQASDGATTTTDPNLSTALAILNTLRARAAASSISGPYTKAQMRALVFNERRRELALEGELFFDVVRRDRREPGFFATFYGLPAGPDTENKKLLPIPQREILANPNLEQNPGY